MNRRELLKKSAALLGLAYLAPHTISDAPMPTPRKQIAPRKVHPYNSKRLPFTLYIDDELMDCSYLKDIYMESNHATIEMTGTGDTWRKFEINSPRFTLKFIYLNGCEIISTYSRAEWNMDANGNYVYRVWNSIT